MEICSEVNAPDQGALFVAAEIVAGPLLQNADDFREKLPGFLLDCVRIFALHHHAEMLGVAKDMLRHVFNRKHKINCPARDRTARHALELCGFGLLGKSQTTMLFHCAESDRAVGAITRQDYTNDIFFLVVRKQLKDMIDQFPIAALEFFAHAKRAALKAEHRFWRDDVNVVWLNAH